MTTEPTEPGGPLRFFAYGTLAPGRPNEHVLDDVPRTWEPATTTGHLVQDGWGAALGYPSLLVDEAATDVVSGMLLSSDALEERWARLDEFEGDGYERVTIEVTLSNGRNDTAQTYVLRSSPERPGS